MSPRKLFRNLFLATAAACIALVAIALYFQHVVGLSPCPLCIIQRVAFLAAAGVLLVGAFHQPNGFAGRIYAAAAGVIAMLGGLVAARHVWLQNLPAGQVPECGPGLSFLLDAFPLSDALGLILRGSGECAEVQWTLLGLSMPAWSLVWLVVLAALSFFIALRRAR